MRLQGPHSPRTVSTAPSGAWVGRRVTALVVRRTMSALCAAVLAVGVLVVLPQSASAEPCGPGGNPVACENSKPGDPASEWDIVYTGQSSVQGFATTMSVTPGGTVRFKIKASAAYTVDIYRLGYYGGMGARRQAPRWSVTNPVNQPQCATDPSTQNYDCGTWSVSTQWAVPAAAVSGVYIAKLTSGGDSGEIPFVVRDDSRTSDVLFKTSDATWHAYNPYGGANFYTAPSSLTGTQARAFKVSYNRPYLTRDVQEGRDFLYSNEYPTLRFLERNGVDVTYTSDIDVSAGRTDLTRSKVFLSVGHDEYWTPSERDRVTAARDAGVNLMFLSGNEVYWRSRLEPSIDGTATADRTLVCYKDSWESSKLDPSAEGTATWRDPAAPDGGRPENALTGTIYMSNYTDLPITVSADQGRARLWRNTSLASLPAGTSQELAPHTIGYESDEDVDNGARPAGLMRLSETTGPTEQLVINPAGTQVTPGTTTHSVTLYRAASGALVFSAGTVNWGWGLDQYHDGNNTNPPDPRMQQATLNMLADMGVLPTTLMPGMTMPVASADSTAPTVGITAPAAGTSLQSGSQVTVTGTATDGGGGRVTTVEVSLDGGSSWRRATGTTSWSYTGVMLGTGTRSILARAADDSANLGSAATVQVALTCPCSLFGETTPKTPATGDTSSVELGVRFVPAADGFVNGIRFYKGTGNTGTHTGTLWSGTGSALATGTFTNETGTGWQTLTFDTAVPVRGGTAYVASYHAPNGRYAADSDFFATADWTAGPLTAPGAPVANGVFGDGRTFPTQSYRSTNYWVDVLYSRDDTTPPTVASTSPLAGATSVPSTVRPSATFAGSVDPASVVLTLVDAQGTTVPGSATFDAATRKATYTPSAPLSAGATYTASVRATSSGGVPMAAPRTWSFTVALTDPEPGICPCSVWPDSAVPEVPSASDGRQVQVGMKFRADVDGMITGVRFYKGAANLGPHTGALWTTDGTILGTVDFVGESASGWQTASFSSPVDVAADTVYIVSYTAPAGGYAVTANGLATAIDSGPLHTIAGGGVYTYGAGAPLSASSANYWVDVVYVASDAAPSVSATQPGGGATNVNVTSPVTASFAGYVRPGTARLTVQNAAGDAVTGSVSYQESTRTVSFQPTAALAEGAVYTATASGATALSGNVMQPFTWQFTTAGVSTCPCTLFSSTATPAMADGGDPNAVELGVSFRPTVDGQITGVRFYKSPLNGGSHTGTLWSDSGAVLARGTFTGESASGWQTLTFTAPVAVQSGTTYVASYHAPQGRYSATSGFFTNGWSNGPLVTEGANGRYRYSATPAFPTSTYGATNYWIDPIFLTGTPPDTTPPTVTSVTPLDGSTSQPVSSTPTATFDEDLDAASVGMTLSSSAGAVTGSVGYDAATRTARFTPGAPLARGVTYTATATAADTAGNAVSPPRTWQFTTAQPDPEPGVCPCSLWTDATQPTTLTDPDRNAIELGTAFTTDVAAQLRAVRFYKGPENAGPHTVSVWSADGTRLASATSTSESTQGWQTVTLDTPVALAADTTYVVSYLAPAGRYSSLAQGLSTPIDRSPLRTPATAGRYLYGGGFPTGSSGASYLVDPVVHRADGTPATISGLAATAGTRSATITWQTDEPASTSVAYGTSPTALTSSATGASGTDHSVALTGLDDGRTYYYRVTSVDGSGNSTTAPAAASAPGTFATPDTVAPTITAVAATGSGTTATVTWTTDEPATSAVAYGTSATTLGSTATGASGTTHSVTLTGLAPNTRYHYRVTSADPSGNTSTAPDAAGAPAQYVPTVEPIARTSVADFSSGSGGYIGDDSGGELMASPNEGYEFTAATLPTSLRSTALGSGGATTLSGGQASVDGAHLATTALRGTTALRTKATLAPGQSLGLSRTAGFTGVRVGFAVTAAGGLELVRNDGTTTTATPVAGTFTGTPRVFEVRRVSGGAVTWLVDGTQVGTATLASTLTLGASLVDPTVGGAALVADWMIVGIFATSSTWNSAVVDAGAVVAWETLQRDVAAPAGTAVTIRIRSGNVAVPDGTWTGWTTVSASTGSIARQARYVQVRVVSASSADRFASPRTAGFGLTFRVP